MLLVLRSFCVPLLSGCMCLGLALSSARADSVNLVKNGSFESVAVAGVSAELGSRTTADSASPIQNVTGWTSAADGQYLGYNLVFMGNSTTNASGQYGSAYGSRYGAIQLAGQQNGVSNGIGVSPDGGNFLALDANYGTTAISQVMNGLTPGQATMVSFYYAGAQQYGYAGSNSEGFLVSLTDAATGSVVSSTTPMLNIGAQGFSGWDYYSFSFLPTDSTETLSFLAQSGPNGAPPFALLDGVSVVATTPEPSTMALLGTGVIAIGAILRRRRSR
jgi:hypothetical protein